MGATQSQLTSVLLGCIAGASVVVFVAVSAPPLLTLPPGGGVRPWGVLPLLTLLFVGGFWMMCVGLGVRQLFVRPCRYGLYSIGFGMLQLAAFLLIEWLLVRSRGLYWAP